MTSICTTVPSTVARAAPRIPIPRGNTKNHLGIQPFQKCLVHGLLPADGFVHIFDHLSGSVPQGGRAVEDGGNEGVAGIFQQELGGIQLNIVVKIVILTAAA